MWICPVEVPSRRWDVERERESVVMVSLEWTEGETGSGQRELPRLKGPRRQRVRPVRILPFVRS